MRWRVTQLERVNMKEGIQGILIDAKTLNHSIYLLLQAINQLFQTPPKSLFFIIILENFLLENNNQLEDNTFTSTLLERLGAVYCRKSF
jgi:hypothetical protein